MRRGASMMVVLGISAVDVLCCALVSSLVLFLMFSGTGQRALSSSGNSISDLVIILSRPPVEMSSSAPELRVQVGMRSKQPVPTAEYSFWTDSPSEETRAREVPKLLLSPGGVMRWASELPSDGRGPRTSVLAIHRPAPGDWSIEIGYLDTSDGLLTPASSSTEVAVTILGACEARLRMRLNIGERRRLEALSAAGSEGCEPAEGLRVVGVS